MTKSKPLHYQLSTKNCWSHTLTKLDQQFDHSPHYHDGRFHNEHESEKKSGKYKLFKWLIGRDAKSWNTDIEREFNEILAQSIDMQPIKSSTDPKQWKVWFVGHATALIKIGPYNFLTDPVWAEYAGPKSGTGPKRVCPAGIALENLPPIHGVLLSHNHYDHMDIATLEWLHEQFQMPIYTGLGNSYYLPKHFHVIELDWWQSAYLDDFEIIYTPAQHGSGRGLRDQNQALWGGFCLRKDGQYLYFAGDTGYSTHFKEIHTRYGAPRVALLPIGAYEPRALMKYMHMNPYDALKAHMDLQAQRSIAIHYRTFQLTDEDRNQPEEVLEHAIEHASKLMNPFYCIHEGKKLIV
ncbi:MBL fold metallo-hydrolase [Acinetobacter nectaris]|uniref:MBL fold metallo-hydrolase n=1 Tax=Acinetobacter nectaris TaxID=1219382 RepID=UPI001F48953A|nr:MBL fold metallo-hydrolase [Acinetobacter nectaris]MCF9045486.1 MBL fold metallo-hydrolase [Acinetobacter nectaris]